MLIWKNHDSGGSITDRVWPVYFGITDIDESDCSHIAMIGIARGQEPCSLIWRHPKTFKTRQEAQEACSDPLLAMQKAMNLMRDGML